MSNVSSLRATCLRYCTVQSVLVLIVRNTLKIHVVAIVAFNVYVNLLYAVSSSHAVKQHAVQTTIMVVKMLLINFIFMIL